MYAFNTYMWISVTHLNYFKVQVSCCICLHLFYVYTFIFFYINYPLFCPPLIYFETIFMSIWAHICFSFLLLAFKAWLFCFKEKKQTYKKIYFCFTGSEAETHDVISDDNVIYFLLWNECLVSLTLWEMGDKLKKLYAYLERQLYKHQKFACLLNTSTLVHVNTSCSYFRKQNIVMENLELFLSLDLHWLNFLSKLLYLQAVFVTVGSFFWQEKGIMNVLNETSMSKSLSICSVM